MHSKRWPWGRSVNYVACVGIKDVSFLFVLLLLMFFPAITHCAISRNFITFLFRKSMVEFVFIKANINQIKRHCNNPNYWRESLHEVIRQKIAKWCQQTFYFQKYVDNAQQCFAFTPKANFPAHNLNFHWRWWDQIQASF